MSYVEIQTSYLVLSPQLWNERFQVILREQGLLQSQFVNMAIADYFQANIDYYLAVGQQDAEARGYKKEQDFYQALLVDDLGPWLDGLRPDFPTSPLRRITDAGEARKNQHRLKQIRVSEYNAALIRLALEVDDLTMIQLLSRIVVWHFNQYWDAKGGYQWQIFGSEQETLEPEI